MHISHPSYFSVLWHVTPTKQQPRKAPTNMEFHEDILSRRNSSLQNGRCMLSTTAVVDYFWCSIRSIYNVFCYLNEIII